LPLVYAFLPNKKAPIFIKLFKIICSKLKKPVQRLDIDLETVIFFDFEPSVIQLINLIYLEQNLVEICIAQLKSGDDFQIRKMQ
jgi:hypothetical protein